MSGINPCKYTSFLLCHALWQCQPSVWNKSLQIQVYQFLLHHALSLWPTKCAEQILANTCTPVFQSGCATTFVRCKSLHGKVFQSCCHYFFVRCSFSSALLRGCIHDQRVLYSINHHNYCCHYSRIPGVVNNRWPNNTPLQAGGVPTNVSIHKLFTNFQDLFFVGGVFFKIQRSVW